MTNGLPGGQELTEGQMQFVVDFASACDNAWDDMSKPVQERRQHLVILLGQGGSGKTHVVQNIVFPAVQFIWPEDALQVVASSNAQATNISTDAVRARTVHGACAMRVQSLVNPKMRPGQKLASLTRTWDKCMVLVIEECSMISGGLYNMLDFRAMHGRSRTHEVYEHTYAQPGCAFGRIPIVIHLGDFLQLRPTAGISLIEDLHATDEDGEYIHRDVSLEVQHACRLFKSIRNVFELHGTKRFVPGDPLVEFLQCMRVGRRMPDSVWAAFESTFATDGRGLLDPRHAEAKFRHGFGMAMYWETLARWINSRAQRDARLLGVPLVFCQCFDQCGTMTREIAARFLNVYNIHHTGHMHGVFAAHVGMRVRFTQKINGELGLVQERRGTIADIVFHPDDAAQYARTSAGAIFRPARLPAGFWLQVDNFTQCPIRTELVELGGVEEARARSMFFLPAVEKECVFESSDKHVVMRSGFQLTHAQYMTATAAQGQTIRTGVTIDCARIEARGNTGMSDGNWWLNLYVMFSRPTKMSDMLLLRPPSREFLERGPPDSLKQQLEAFEEKVAATKERTRALAAELGFFVPRE